MIRYTVLLLILLALSATCDAQIRRRAKTDTGYYGQVCIDGVCYLKPCGANCGTQMCLQRQAAIDAAYARQRSRQRRVTVTRSVSQQPTATLLGPSVMLSKPTQAVSAVVSLQASHRSTAADDSLFAASTEEQVSEMLDLMGVDETSVLVDAGAGGLGRIVIGAARRGAIAIGVENDRQQYEQLHRRIHDYHLTGRAFAVQADATEYDYQRATHVTIHQFPDLVPRIVKQVPEGVKVVSNGHWFLGSERIDAAAGVYYVRPRE